MLKMYHRHNQEGGSPAYWDEVWSDGKFEEGLRFCEIDPLRPIFERYAMPGQMMLEGGCGRGHYVAYYTMRGVKVVGLDFARQTLTELRQRDRNLVLCAGDVAHLPFRDALFDVYYSGGVVEHFEAGARPSLGEARRVLRPGGILLISVPYLSPLRRVMALLVRRNDRKWVPRPAIETPTDRKGRRFFQYAYSPREFKRVLVAEGFHVVTTKGYSIIWGLYELPWVAQVMNKLERCRRLDRAKSQGATTTSKANGESGTSQVRTALLKRILIGEDDRVPVAGVIIRALRWACANMMMYVCIRPEQRPIS